MPDKPTKPLTLKDTCGVEPGEPGRNGTTQVNSKEEAKENLKQFIDSMHQKAAQVIGWINGIEEKANERTAKPLFCKIILAALPLKIKVTSKIINHRLRE